MLRHMKWANQQIFSHISQLPDEALNSFVTALEFKGFKAPSSYSAAITSPTTFTWKSS
jgi:hypothetical protein